MSKKINTSNLFTNFKELVNIATINYDLSEYEAEKIVESLMCTNSISSMEDVLQFYDLQRKSNPAKVEKKALTTLSKWEISDQKISHESGSFFEIIGISTTNSSSREVGNKGWDQPIIQEKNNKGGLLGLIRTKINGLPHYLVDAKFEPGNFQDIQLSPTLQATFSNIERAHGGNPPSYLEFFRDYELKENYIFNNWMTEDGGRLYKKRNLGLVKFVEFEEIGPLKSSFIFLSRHQITTLSKTNSIINPHLMRLIHF